MAFDTLIKGGTVYDGEHAEPTVQDIGIKDGVIIALGHLSEQAKETIDADGAIVTPAWIDIHTHYDGQVTWDQEMDPSASTVSARLSWVTAGGLRSCSDKRRARSD